MDQNQLMQLLASALAPYQKELGQKHTYPTGTPSTPYTHGPGGLFGVAGIERDLIHTRVRGRGLAWRLPSMASVYTDPLYAYITGFQDSTGSNPTGPCDDGKIVGSMKSCLQTAQFGRYPLMTRELEVNRVGQLINRGEFNDLRLLNDPIVPELGSSIFPTMSGQSQLNAGAEMLSRFLEVGQEYVNILGRQTYIGNPTNNTAGGYAEFPGLDILIGTNKVDAITGTSCPSLNSDIKDYNYQKVDEVGTSPSIVTVLTALFRYVKHLASHTGLDPATWAITMRQSLFWEITDIWACQYYSYRCSTFDGDNIDPTPMFDTGDAIAMRDSMRNGEYLMIDGMKIPVIIDSFIVEESEGDQAQIDAGCFASDIYIVPLTVQGGRAVTFWHYFDYSKGPMQAVVDGRETNFFWTDGGRYLWHAKPPLNWCIQHIAKVEPRLILLTPQIAGRLTNVQYCPLQHERDAHPDDDYFVDGGVTERVSPSHWSDWNLPAQ